MIKPSNLLFNCLFAVTLPIIGLLLFWWSGYFIFEDEHWIAMSAFTGLALGMLSSIYIKIVHKPNIFKVPTPILILVYLFYNIGMFGFFMGVPVFHPLLGVLAGFYQAKRMIYLNNLNHDATNVHSLSRFTAITMGCICLLSAYFALTNITTAHEIQHMLKLPFEITKNALIGTIIGGGIFLIVVQYWLTKFTMVKILAYHTKMHTEK